MSCSRNGVLSEGIHQHHGKAGGLILACHSSQPLIWLPSVERACEMTCAKAYETACNGLWNASASETQRAAKRVAKWVVKCVVARVVKNIVKRVRAANSGHANRPRFQHHDGTPRFNAHPGPSAYLLYSLLRRSRSSLAVIRIHRRLRPPVL